MFYTIKNNQLNEWSDTQEALDFKGEAKELLGVSVSEFDPKKYDIQNDTLVDISSTELYKDVLKKERMEFVQKNCVPTSVGYLRRQTKAGDLLSIFNSYSRIVQLENSLPAGVLLIYDETGESFFNNEMTFNEFNELFKEVANAYLQDFKES